MKAPTESVPFKGPRWPKSPICRFLASHSNNYGQMRKTLCSVPRAEIQTAFPIASGSLPEIQSQPGNFQLQQVPAHKAALSTLAKPTRNAAHYFSFKFPRPIVTACCLTSESAGISQFNLGVLIPKSICSDKLLVFAPASVSSSQRFH